MEDIFKLKVKGFFTIQDKFGNILLYKKNLIVNNAKMILASALVGSPSADYISYIVLGTGTTPPVITNAQLESQTYQIAVSYNSEPKPYFSDKEDAGITTLNSIIHFSGIVPADKILTNITEAGLFSAKEFLFSRITFNAISKTNNNIWLLTWKLEMELI